MIFCVWIWFGLDLLLILAVCERGAGWAIDTPRHKRFEQRREFVERNVFMESWILQRVYTSNSYKLIQGATQSRYTIFIKHRH